MSSDGSGFYSGGGMAVWSTKGTPPKATTGTATCTGDITTTFTWVPDQGNSTTDPPPTSVVIAEEGNTAVSSYNSVPDTVATTATCDNGLGFSFVPTTGSNNSKNGTSNGTRYQIKENPGSAFTIKCSPSATVEGTGIDWPPTTNGGNLSLRYKATALPLEVVLSGGIGPKNNKSFLIGQQVSGSISAGGLPVVPKSCNWSADAGSPFSDYKVVWSASTPNTTSATFVPLGTQTQPTVSFHFKQAPTGGATANVSTPVTLAVPAGALPAAGLTTTLTQQCYIDPPNKTIDVHIGTVQGLPNAASPQYMGLSGATTPEGDIVGIFWRGTVTTPSKYGSGGGWNVTQLITPSRTRRENGVMQKTQANGVLALDTTFGYEPVSPKPLYTDNGVVQGNSDSPSTPWDTTTSIKSANDSFNDYMMYLPNGTGSCYVPLRAFNWFWAGQAQPNGSTGAWQLSNTNSGWSLGAEYPAHPQWTTNSAQGLNIWINQ